MALLCAGACHSTSRSGKSQGDAASAENAITGKYWRLIELNGRPVTQASQQNEPRLTFREENLQMDGNGGCNSFRGNYELGEMGRIRFFGVVATQKACLHMETEKELFKVFDMADNYALSADGKILSLNRARMAPLARFEAVYMQ
jgi:heat shock protein HslJ